MHLFVFTGKIREPLVLFDDVSISSSGFASSVQELITRAADSISSYNGRVLIVNPSENKSIELSVIKSIDNTETMCKISGFNSDINEPIQMELKVVYNFIIEFFTGKSS